MSTRVRDFISATAVAAALAVAPGVASAQDDTTTAEQEGAGNGDLGLQGGEPVDDQGRPLGEEYILETSGDWEIRCVTTSLPDDPCTLHQVLREQGDSPVAEISVFNLPDGDRFEAASTVATPLETLLSAKVTLSVDGGSRRRYDFTFCTPSSCVAQFGMETAVVDAFRRGAEALIEIVPLRARDQTVGLTVSLMGFTAGYERIEELNAANAAAIAASRAEQAGQSGE